VAMVERVRHGGGAPEVEDSSGRMGQRRAADAVGGGVAKTNEKGNGKGGKMGRRKRKKKITVTETHVGLSAG
jgi:hypothetical protein